MSLLNAKPRFGLDDETGQLYDYVHKRYFAAGEFVVEDHGVWDTQKVRELIESGKSIESAFTANSAPATSESSDKVQQAAIDFAKEPLTGEVAAQSEAPAATEQPAEDPKEETADTEAPAA